VVAPPVALAGFAWGHIIFSRAVILVGVSRPALGVLNQRYRAGARMGPPFSGRVCRHITQRQPPFRWWVGRHVSRRGSPFRWRVGRHVTRRGSPVIRSQRHGWGDRHPKAGGVICATRWYSTYLFESPSGRWRATLPPVVLLIRAGEIRGDADAGPVVAIDAVSPASAGLVVVEVVACEVAWFGVLVGLVVELECATAGRDGWIEDSRAGTVSISGPREQPVLLSPLLETLILVIVQGGAERDSRGTAGPVHGGGGLGVELLVGA